jgi:hypothetical protein
MGLMGLICPIAATRGDPGGDARRWVKNELKGTVAVKLAKFLYLCEIKPKISTK